MLHPDTGFVPFRDPWVRALLILLTIVVAIHLGQTVWVLVSQVSDLIMLFVVAWLIAFVLEPAVAPLSRIPLLSRTLAVLLIYLAVFVGLSVGAVVLLPELATQSTQAAKELPAFAERVSAWGSGILAFLADRGISVGVSADQLLRPVEAIGPALVANAFSLATGTAAALVQVLLVLVLSVYFVLDSERIGHTLLAAVPLRYRDDFTYFVSSVYRAFGGFIRGQIIQAAVYGVGVAVIMLATGLPFVTLGAVLAGLLMFIQFFGAPLSLLPSVGIALTEDLGRAVLVLALTLGLNTAVVNVVAPKVMSQQIGLHPIVVLASVLIGVRLAGPWGALFGVPVAAVIAAMVSFYQLTHAERRERVLGVANGQPGSNGPAADQPVAVLSSAGDDVAQSPG